MNRRSTEVKGFVNFPVYAPGYFSTEEGGMFVKIVVDYNYDYPVCADTEMTVNHSTCLLHDDRFDDVVKKEDVAFLKDEFTDEDDEKLTLFHYPRLHCNQASDPPVDYSSRPYLAVILIGTTGWSGCKEEGNEMWKCTYDDLTDDGKNLYDLVSKLYPGCNVHILTYLDT